MTDYTNASKHEHNGGGAAPKNSSQSANGGSLAFISAVHQLVNSERTITKVDLLLAAAAHAIHESDKTAVEIHERVNQVWPGANASQADVDLALTLGNQLGLIATSSGLDDSVLWTLTKDGLLDVERHTSWVNEIRNVAINELIAKAESGLQYTPDQSVAELWLNKLTRALIAGIETAQAAYLGQVEKIVGGRLLPKSIDKQRVLADLSDDVVPEETQEFLKALALAALNPLDPFGNELVSHITIGCVLHSYIVGRDSEKIVQRIGAPDNERAVIDTPILIDLLGPQRVRRTTETTIRAAVQQKWDVIVLEHSLQELVEVVEREIPKLEESLKLAHANGTRQAWYASLLEDQLPALCIEAFQDGTYRNYQQIIDAARGLSSTLVNFGATVRAHHNENDHAYVERAKVALEDQLGRLNPSKGRSPHVIQRDVETMAVAWRRRRNQTRSKWPGAWVITTDRSMGKAYLSAQPKDTVSLTLTLAQWTTLISVASPAIAVQELAEAAAGQLVEEAMWLIPARFPADVAMTLAHHLDPLHGGSDVDLGIAQLTLDDIFDDTEQRQNPTAMASTVLSRRARRIDQIQKLKAADRDTRLSRAEEVRFKAERDAERAELAKRASEADLERLRASDSRKEEELRWKGIQLKRVLVSALILTASLIALTISIVTDMSTATVAFLTIGFLVFSIAAYHWCTHPGRRLMPLLAGITTQVVGLVAAALDLADRI